MEYQFESQRIVGGIGADDEFWRGLERGVFLLPRCEGCDAWTWPAHYRCGRCGAWSFRWEERAMTGKVFSWTRSWYAFDRVRERSDDIPYATLVVEIEDAGGARIIGALEGDDADLRVGVSVVGRIEPPSAKTKGYATVVWRLLGDTQ